MVVPMKMGYRGLEPMQLDLNADPVVLSACETARGRIVGEE
jgi:CHAT domain-containing protein